MWALFGQRLPVFKVIKNNFIRNNCPIFFCFSAKFLHFWRHMKDFCACVRIASSRSPCSRGVMPALSAEHIIIETLQRCCYHYGCLGEISIVSVIYEENVRNQSATSVRYSWLSSLLKVEPDVLKICVHFLKTLLKMKSPFPKALTSSPDMLLIWSLGHKAK